MVANAQKRLEQIEVTLSPLQLVQLLMRKARESGSLSECAMWLSENLEKVLDRRSAALHESSRDVPPAVEAETLRRLRSEQIFLFELWLAGMDFSEKAIERNLPRAAHAGAEVQATLELRSRRNAASDLSKILAQVPYPLDRDDAAAVAAAADHYVVPWDGFIADHLPAWMATASESGGESAQTSISKDADPAAAAGRTAPARSELPCDDNAARERAFEHTVRALINAGGVKAGSVVIIGPAPFECLDLAPLVDGEWIDAHVVELAEFGAAVEHRALEFRATFAKPFLRPMRICRPQGRSLVEGDDALIAAVRAETKARLRKFAGRTRLIDGRIYLRLEDYRAWEAREVEDELGVLDGILISSWNDWIDTHTGDGGAMLAGIRIDKLVAPIDPSEFVVCPSRDDVRTRLQCFDRLRSQRHSGDLNDDADADRAGIDPSELVVTAERVKLLVAALLEDLYAADFALGAISDHYFRGHPMVLVDQEERLRELIDLAEKFGRLFNAVVNAKNAFGESLTAPIDVDRVRQAAKEHNKVIATALIDAAKKRTLLLLSDPKDAVKALMGKSPS